MGQAAVSCQQPAGRLEYTGEAGCDVAAIVTEEGSKSQRKAQRAGFLVAYTRLKWKKDR